jgi:L-serine/L-threonine ammonia-lyase
MGSIPHPTLPLPYTTTPLLPSPTLSRSANCTIYLKLENLQPSGSFKSRGIGNLIHHQATLNSSSPKPLHFYCSSGGNAGLAAAHAAKTLGYPCTVVLPVSTEASMVAKLKNAGCEDVIVHGESWMYSDTHMREVVMVEARKRGVEAVYVPPFDHPLIWEGASSIVSEVARQMPNGERPDAIICSVGGGGLFVGIKQGLEAVGWGDTRVVAVETKGAESLNDSLVAGELVTRKKISSVALSLGAVRVANKAFELAQEKNVSSVVLSDAEACMACWRFVDDERLLVEPACGASVSLAYMPEKLREALPGLKEDSKVVIVVCGGSRISVKELESYRARFSEEVKHLEMTSDKEVASTFTA